MINERDIENVLKSVYTKIISNIKKSSGKGAGWIIDSVIDHNISISKYNPLAGSCYIKLAVCFAATQHPNSLIPFPTLINTVFTSNNAIFNSTTHTHFFHTFLIKKTCTFFYNTLKSKLKKKILRNPKILKLGMPKRMTPKSQAKIKPPFQQYPFFKYS